MQITTTTTTTATTTTATTTTTTTTTNNNNNNAPTAMTWQPNFLPHICRSNASSTSRFLAVFLHL